MAAKRARVARTVDEYLARLPDEQREALERVRRQVRAAAPRVEERISYQMPGFFLNGRGLVWMGAFREHLSLFPGAFRFTPEEPLPASVVKKLVRARAAAEKARATKKPRPATRTARPRRPTR